MVLLNEAINAYESDKYNLYGELNNKAKKASEISEISEIKKVAKSFESIFLEIVLKSMRNTIPKSNLIDGGNAEDIYRGMLDSEYSKMMNLKSSSSLAKSIEKELLSLTSKTEQVSSDLREELGHKVYTTNKN